jgi:aminoglycoside phosphotransferase (APT) family kinase protein
VNELADGTPPAADLAAALRRLGLLAADASACFTPLPGGVSSDIWRVDLADGPICVKRALAKLKVAADWRAPTERNAYEVAWIEAANAIVPGVAPRILGHDRTAGLFAMAFLDPAKHPLWKAQLMAGRVDPAFAMQVGHRLVTIHARTARRPAIAARFATDASFHAIRLEPYLEATARAHPDLAAALAGLVATTASTRLALVHGDVSPKNILAGPQGPVFLDAECAWYGDPAFDLAFCLNHLLLKCLWRPAASDLYIGCFNALTNAYAGGVDWEPVTAVEVRAARLLPGLLLARIDGKSPVEYVTDPAQKDLARAFARRLLREPAEHLDAVVEGWDAALGEAGLRR